jgi:predicted ATP-dependent endonuclease of OLD family
VQLKSVRVQNYRSIDDSGVVPIDDITCMVGKNEAGKTAFLQALHLLNPLNPINGKTEYDDVMDYPSKRFAAYKRVREDEPANVVTAEFELTDKEVAKIEAALGAGVMKSRRVTVKKGYNGTIYYTSSTDVQVAIAHLTSSVEAPAADKKAIKGATSEEELIAALQAVDEPHSSVTELLEKVTGWRKQNLSLHILGTYLAKWLPRFFYFSDYSTMKGKVSLPDLRAKEAANTLDESDKTFLSLAGDRGR